MSKSNRQGCAIPKENKAGSAKEDLNFREKPHELSHIKNVIGVFSGAGGVGKSLVTSMLAVMMRRERFRTAILDADVTGPSISMAFGLTRKPEIDDAGIFPARTGIGIPIMSLNLPMKDGTDPVICRDSMISDGVNQFWEKVMWGNMDYLFVDMPPGTGNVPPKVFRSLPLTGVIIVTSPQALVGMIAENAINMAEKMKIPVIALVENMSYIRCPDSESVHSVFGGSRIDKIAEKHGIDTVCRLPIDPELASAVDSGTIELFEGEELNSIIIKLIRKEQMLCESR
ncbi:Iron-sulfur cluster carrier protein [bioreactor metagenome]|uniref:Iron-sulfur cluster carrier protein n=1 Tax=bioreactor metagenome TaxID=1076179 RepID=A0A644WS48_9ZZZZ